MAKLISLENLQLYRELAKDEIIEVKTTAEWGDYTSFIPTKDQIIVYSDARTDSNDIVYPGVKIGDGVSTCAELPFITGDLEARIISHVNNAAIHVTAADKTNWDNKVSCSLSNKNLIFSVTSSDDSGSSGVATTVEITRDAIVDALGYTPAKSTDIPKKTSQLENDSSYVTSSQMSTKVGYAEYADSYLCLYSDSSKGTQIAKLLIKGGSSDSGISEAECKTIIETYGYATTSDFYSKTEIDTKLGAKQDALTDADKQAIADLHEDPTVPSSLGDLSDDSTHRLVTDAEKAAWNAKADTSDIPTVPTDEISANTTARHTHTNKSVLDAISSSIVDSWNSAVTWITTNGSNVLSHLSDSVKHITADERAAWNAKQDSISDLATIRSGAEAGATALQSFTETDPTVPSWAKADTKPSYNASEVGALPDTTTIPFKTSELTNDSDFVADADYVHTDSNYTVTEKTKLSGIAEGANKTVVDSALSDSSENPVQNKVVNAEFTQLKADFADYQKLTDSTLETSDKTVVGAINEVNDGLDNSLYSTTAGGKNLLNPSNANETAIFNGIKITNNGDGTYTLNGTTTSTAVIRIYESVILESGKTYKIIGCPSGGKFATYCVRFYIDGGTAYEDDGDGVTVTGDGNSYIFAVRIASGATVSSLVVKPMVTLDTSATYDDFVPYVESNTQLKADIPTKTSQLTNDSGYVTDISGKADKSVVDSIGSTVLLTNSVSAAGTLTLDNNITDDYRFVLATCELTNGGFRGSTIMPVSFFKSGRMIMASDAVHPESIYYICTYLTDSSIEVTEYSVTDKTSGNVYTRKFALYGIK